jgi:hypothetical protein
MTSLAEKLKGLAFHLTKIINKAEELTYFSTNIGWELELGRSPQIIAKDLFLITLTGLMFLSYRFLTKLKLKWEIKIAFSSPPNILLR